MNTMRNTLNAVRYDLLGVRIGGPGESMRGQWPVLIVAGLVVFGCFFAIGRAFAGGGSTREVGSSREGPAVAAVSRATIPVQLAGGSPIAAVPRTIVEPPPPPKPARRRGREALGTGAATQAAAGTESASQAERRAAPEAEAKAAPAPASTGGGSSGSKPARGGSRPRSGGSGGGSFDSSE